MLCAWGCSRPAEEPPITKTRQTPAAKPSLPATDHAPPHDATTTMVSVTVTPTKLFVRGRPVEPTQLHPQLEALAKRLPNATVAVQVDATVPEPRLTEVTQAIESAGFSSVAVARRPVP